MINWTEFKNLPLTDQLDLFNKHNLEYKNLQATCNALGYGYSTVKRHFKNMDCIYNAKTFKYSLATQKTPNTQYATLEQFQQLQKQINDLKELISNNNNNKPANNTNKATNNNDIEDVSITVAKTFRLSPSSLERLEGYFKEHIQLSKATLLSHIINSYLDDYYNK